jgi:polyhydroxyalkanoate synthesis regulator phasin
VKLTKTDEELGVAYGIVYAPDEIDAQGDTASADEIRKAAYEFIRFNGANAVDVNHDLQTRSDAYICESWIVKADDPLFSEAGAWAVGVRLESEELRNAVKSGELGALSMYGEANVSISDDEKSVDKGLLNAIKSAIKSLFDEADLLNLNKGKEQEMTEEQTAALIKSVTDGFNAKIDEAIASQLERLAALDKQIADINAELSKSKQTIETKKTDEKPAYKGVL